MRSASKFPISELTNSICLGMRVNMLNHVLLLMSFWLLTLAYLDLTELGMFRGCLSTWHAPSWDVAWPRGLTHRLGTLILWALVLFWVLSTCVTLDVLIIIANMCINTYIVVSLY